MVFMLVAASSVECLSLGETNRFGNAFNFATPRTPSLFRSGRSDWHNLSYLT